MIAASDRDLDRARIPPRDGAHAHHRRGGGDQSDAVDQQLEGQHGNGDQDKGPPGDACDGLAAHRHRALGGDRAADRDQQPGQEPGKEPRSHAVGGSYVE